MFSFLHGLNKDLDEVRGMILRMKPLPSIKKVFAEVRREESQKRVMLGGTKDQNTDSMVHNSALLANKNKPLEFNA